MVKESAGPGPADVEPERTIVYLGNRKAISVQDGERVPYSGKRCTTVILRDGIGLMEAAQDIISPRGVWAAHSDAAGPAWVAASGPLGAALAALIADNYGCEIRDPDPATEG